MPKRLKQKADPNQSAHAVLQQATEEPEAPNVNLSIYMAEIGRRGGKKGGKRRMETMSAAARKRVAAAAAKARWAKARKKR